VKTTLHRASDLFFPLDEFYSSDGRSLPLIEAIDGAEMPEPYRQLLVHQGDMTPTLEQFHGGRISLKLFDKRLGADGWFSRRVALILDHTGSPVEFGAIRINLNLFSPDARAHILEGRRPLGTILNEDGIRHSSRPIAFLRVRSDDLINETLSLTKVHTLYGRRNVLYNEMNEPLAEVVEVLPPTQPGS
jgi:chorismate-pyruvate lyase